MYPVLFTLGPLAVSSFGFFLALAFLVAVFIIWRLGRVYDVGEEKILDLIILSFLGGIMGARIFFVATNWSAFDDLTKMIFINRYPGLSFWGGLMGGLVTLRLLTGRFKLNFWQMADFAAVAFLMGIVLSNLGCFLGGCAYGVPSNYFLAAPVVGQIGKRFPVSVVEGLIVLITFFFLWGQVIRFHFTGKIIALSFIILGVIKFGTEFYRGDSRFVFPSFWLSYGHLLSAAIFTSGWVIFYTQSKRSLLTDLLDIKLVLSSKKQRKAALGHLQKVAYNCKVDWQIKLANGVEFLTSLPRVLKRRLNVKPTPKNIR